MLHTDTARTVYEAFVASAATYPDRPFFHVPRAAAKGYSDTAVEIAYAPALERVNAIAAALTAAGVLRGHRIALMLGNRVECFLHYLALTAIGASAVPLNAEATPAESAHVLRDSGSALVIAWPEHHALLAQVGALLATVPPVGAPEAPLPRVTMPTRTDGEEVALMYTSGSTGDPKGCILSNRYMMVMGRWYVGIGGPCALTPGAERLITPLPLVHMNALATSGTAMVLTGGCIVQLDRFHPSTWWQSVRESRATVVHYLGVMPAMLLQAPLSEQDREHCVKFGFGAGVLPKHHANFEARFGFPLIESWSMTEVGGAAAVVANVEPRHVGTRCFGKAEAFMRARIVDDAGRDVAPGEPGELLVCRAGPDPRDGFFSGYANKPALTDEAWAGGWFHTGDVVRQGEDGSFHFVDRKKSIVRRSGENIASLEVEGAITQLPQVEGVGVGPVDDDIRGEEVMAVIRLRAGEPATLQTALALFAAAGERLAYFKLPGWIAFVDALPLTPSQKLQRGTLKTLSRDLVAQGRAFDLRDRKKRPAAQGTH